MKDNPVVMNALSISAAIVVFKALMSLGQTMGWWNLTEEQNGALANFLDIAVPIVAVWVGVVWTNRQTTPLAKPTDVDGVPLSRPNDMAPIKVQEQAIVMNEKIDKQITRGLDTEPTKPSVGLTGLRTPK